jgi:hypothetical protein
MTDQGYKPVAPAHDRRHDDPQANAEDPTRLHPQREGLRCVSWTLARHCEQGGCPPLSAASDIERCGHAKDQQHREKAGTSRARCEGRWRLTSWA